MPAGSSEGPFKHTPAAAGSSFGSWTYHGQGASGFMACPVSQGPKSTSSPTPTPTPKPFARETAPVEPHWQVFAALQNATVPTGKIGDCVGFDALAVPVNVTSNQLAWEYI